MSISSGALVKAPSILSTSAEATREVGRRLGRAARAGDVLLLEGPLGSGKTVLVQGLAQGLGAGGEVQSPTFVLIRHYQGRLELVHADLHRLAARAEIEALGLLDLSAEGVLVVEWADRAPWLGSAQPGAGRLSLLPGAGENDRQLSLLHGPDHLRPVFASAPAASR